MSKPQLSPNWPPDAKEIYPGRDGSHREQKFVNGKMVEITVEADEVPSVGEAFKEFVDTLELKCATCEQAFTGYRTKWPSGRVIEPPADCYECLAKANPEQAPAPVDRNETWKAICKDELFQDSRLVGYVPKRIKDAFHEAYMRILRGDKKNGIYATGETGTFKTTMMWHVLRMLHLKGWTVHAYTINELSDAVIDSYSTETHGVLLRNLVGSGVRDILLIDDIDKCGMLGKSQAPPSTSKAVFDIVDGRCRAGRPILITTNARADAIDEIYGEQHGSTIRRRLQDMCTVIETTKLAPPTPKRYND